MIVCEKELQFDFPGERCRKFDKETELFRTHMKGVDFIVELDDHVMFIEVKDPECTGALANHERRPAMAEKKCCRGEEDFVEKFKSGRLDADLIYTYRDSFLYEWAAGRITKPIYYFVLVAISSMDSAMMATRTFNLKKRLPMERPPDWIQEIVHDCAVFNIETWNRNFPDFPVERKGRRP